MYIMKIVFGLSVSTIELYTGYHGTVYKLYKLYIIIVVVVKWALWKSTLLLERIVLGFYFFYLKMNIPNSNV